MEQSKELNINKRQKEFYETKRKNLPSRLWSFFRNGVLNKTRKRIGIEQQVYNLHRNWLGDLSDKKILDLGCSSGNALSSFLATNAKDYVGIDLSESAIERLRKRLKGIPQARAVAVDFLSADFKEKEFDVIYAYGVLHHFRDTDLLITRLKEKLKPEGIIISNDPLQTSLPVKILRGLYRPFQSDKDWEWPFSRKVYYQYKKAFEIKDRRGVLGKTKWIFLMSILPFSSKKKSRLGYNWHQEDWERSKYSDAHMFTCMHLTMLMQKRN